MKKKEFASDIISKIDNNDNIDEIIKFCEYRIYSNGPVDTTILEILSIIKELNPSIFSNYEKEIVKLMGLFFKNDSNLDYDLEEAIMNDYKYSIEEEWKKKLTPMQSQILYDISMCTNYSFASPTSTGKSYVFQHLIENSRGNILIVVPSRALINEFYIKIKEYSNPKDTTVLTFVDLINKKHTRRHIFIVTPERARDVFKFPNLSFSYFLFDEAQLTNEIGERGIYYDGIVRRLRAKYPLTKFIFAHPFVSNPEAQFKKNNIKSYNDKGESFRFKNTGQLFICFDEDEFFIFGTNKEILGEHKVKISYDPLEKVLQKEGGCILIYTAKARIISGKAFTSFAKYIDNFCVKNTSKEMNNIINEIIPLIGAGNGIDSNFIRYLRKGIVVHHGSMPLDVRILVEKFIKSGFCKICFATSTLAQGINMPFDLIYLDTFPESDSLLLRNLIGRAGRSTIEEKFDYGIIVVRKSNMHNIRDIVGYEAEIRTLSQLDDDNIDDDFLEYRDAVKNNDFSFKYNMPNKVIERTEKNKIILENIFLVRQNLKNNEKSSKLKPYLTNIYEAVVLNNRKLNDYEKGIINNANRLLLERYRGMEFSQICRYEYRNAKEETNGSNYQHRFVLKYSNVPNSKLSIHVPLFKEDDDIDYDLIVYNTYDFFDKLIDLKLADIYYMIFNKYAEENNDPLLASFATKLRYGTANEKEIMELRYGFNSSDFSWLNNVINKIDENEIVFNDNVKYLNEFQKSKIERFRY